jgi:phage shock protein A
MEKSNQSSFFKSLALAFGDGLLFGVAMRLAQGSPKARGDAMTDLGPLAERLRKVEDHTQAIDDEALVKFGEGLDLRVLDKVVVALEARLTEHVGQVDRRLAEMDAQLALDLKAVDKHTAAQSGSVEKAIQQIEAQVRDYVAEAQRASAQEISGVDQKLSALQEGLPAKFREIIEAVRQSMEARVALELTEMENRLTARGLASEQLEELQASLRGEIETLSSRLSTEMRDLADHQNSQTAPLQQALQQLETKLTTLREELPPKIRQIVEAVEASMEARISTGDRQTADRMASLEQSLAALRAEMPSAGGLQQAVDESLGRYAEQVGALDQKLTVLQEELPPKIKAIVDAVRQSLDARVSVELQGIEERHTAQIQQAEAHFSNAQEQLRQQLAAESKTPALEQNLAKLQADVAALDARLGTADGRVTDRLSALEQQAAQATAGMPVLEQNLAKLQADVAAMDSWLGTNEGQVSDRLSALEQQAAQATAGVSKELESLRAQHRAQIEQMGSQLRAERSAENLPAQIYSAVTGLRQSLETKLATEIQNLEARTPDRSADVEKALQYASVLEARVQALEQKLQRNSEDTVERAVERVWQALYSRLRQRPAQPLPAPTGIPPVETMSGLRQKSTSAEQSVLDLIDGIGQLFEKPAPRVVRETAPPTAQMHAAPEPVAAVPVSAPPVPPPHIEPEPVVAAHVEPKPIVAAPAQPEPVMAARAVPEPAAAKPAAVMPAPPTPEPHPEIRPQINAEPEPVSPIVSIPKPAAVAPEMFVAPTPAPRYETTMTTAAPEEEEEMAEPRLEQKPPVILFKPRESGRKWRIPFVS